MELPWNLPHGRYFAVFELLHPSALSQEDQLMSVRELVLYVPEALRAERHLAVRDDIACHVHTNPLTDLMKNAGKPSLVDLMKAAGTDKVWRHGYHRFYGTLLEPFRDKVGLKMLEIGVDDGRSMLPWIRFFANAASDGIQGVAYIANGDLATSVCAKENVTGCDKMKVFTGDQSDVAFLRRLIREGAGLNPDAAGKASDWDQGGWDIVIDDGSHVPIHQLVTFAALFPFVRPGGLYVIEDIETSYLDGTVDIYDIPILGAGLGKPPPGNFVEKMKTSFLQAFIRPTLWLTEG